MPATSTWDSAADVDPDSWREKAAGTTVVKFTNWWRGIGDTNLRFIRSFSLATSFTDGQHRRSMRERQSPLRAEEVDGMIRGVVEVVLDDKEYRLHCSGWYVDGLKTVASAVEASVGAADADAATVAEQENWRAVLEVARGSFEGRLCAMTIGRAGESLDEEEGSCVGWTELLAE
ncbi:hypothetical protein LTR86_007608 [Recurvomyces mirabilis]|nr:hypothetical protein LTR86_007608 [Recurvomyces mirabilis]